MYRGRASKWYLACRRSFTGNRCEEESSKSVLMEFSGEGEAFQVTFGHQSDDATIRDYCRLLLLPSWSPETSSFSPEITILAGEAFFLSLDSG